MIWGISSRHFEFTGMRPMSRGSSNPPNPDDVKLLPDSREATAGMLAPASLDPARAIPMTPSVAPPRQLAERPQEDLELAAVELGLDPRRYKTRQHLVAAIH